MVFNLKNKLNNKHFLSLAGNIIMAGLSLVTLGLLYHNLSSAAAGGYVFFQAVFILMDNFRTGFLQTAMIKFYTGSTLERSREVVGSVWLLGQLVTLIFLLLSIPAYYLLPYVSNIGLQLVIKWFSITFICTLPVVISTWLLQANGRFDRILYIRLVNQGSYILAIVMLISYRHLTLNNVLIANLLSSFAAALLVFIKGWANIGTLKSCSRSCIKEIYHFGKYSIGTTVSSTLLRSSDTFIINFILGPAAVAIYNLPQRLMEIIEIPLRSFMATGITSLSAASNRNNPAEVSFIMKKYAGSLTLFVIPVAIIAIAFAHVAVNVLGGGKYAGTEAANVFRIFMLFGILFPIERFQGITLDMIRKPHLNLIKVLCMLCLNVSGDFIGLRISHNIYGVALASIPTFLGGMLFGYIALNKSIAYKFSDVFRVGFKEWKVLLTHYLLKTSFIGKRRYQSKPLT